MRGDTSSIIAWVMTKAFTVIAALLLPVNRRQTSSGLRSLGSRFLPGDLMIDGTLVGGLSGIDYDLLAQRWIVVTDDRTTSAPARFYTASIGLENDRLTSFRITGVTRLTGGKGRTGSATASPDRKPDIESIRVDPECGDLWYVTEGDGESGRGPVLAVGDSSGDCVRSVPLPSMFGLRKDRTAGPRHNQAFESLTFSPDGSLWVCLEGPMYEDGDPPSPVHSSPVRLTNLDRSGRVLRQVACELGPTRRSGRRFELAGVSEIVAIDADRLLVIERQATIGRLPIPRFTIRLFEVDVRGASDIQHIGSLEDADYRPVRKRLVIDLGWKNAGMVTNIEGLAFGPGLDNGHRTLALIADNNLISLLPSQLMVFEILDSELAPGAIVR